MAKKKKKKNKMKEVKEFCMTEVDILNLEKECALQPRMVFKYVKMLNDTNTDIAQAKSDMALTDAEIGESIRANPSDFNLPEKVTVSAAEATILLQPEHKEALVKLQILQKRWGILNAAVKALDHKKSMLEQEVKLHGQSYFATPNPKLVGEQHRDFQKRLEGAKDEAAKKRNSKRKKRK